MNKYWIITFGCQMNKADSERIITILEKNGYYPAQSEKEADLILVNMCSIRQSAVNRVYGLISKFQKLKTGNSKLKTILTGCILKKDKKNFVRHFDLILENKELLNPSEITLRTFTLPLPWQGNDVSFSEVKPKYQNSFSAFVPIMTGCNNFCSFCAVPYTRGREVSRPAEEIICEVGNLIKRGYKELWLLGQNVNDYKSQIPNSKQINFAKLLKMVNDIPGNFWLRFTSPHPVNFTDELIKTIAKCQKVTPYLNLPAQSGDNNILKRMNRPYTVEQYKKLVKKIRGAFRKFRKGLEKEICLSTDVIVGFPGETKKQFENTVKLFKEIKFDMAYIARYSSRPGTAAAKLKDNVSQKEKERREKILTEILKETAFKKNRKYISKKVEILVEETKNGFLFGKTKTYKTVKFKSDENLISEFIKVKIIDATSFGLKGKL